MTSSTMPNVPEEEEQSKSQRNMIKEFLVHIGIGNDDIFLHLERRKYFKSNLIINNKIPLITIVGLFLI